MLCSACNWIAKRYPHYYTGAIVTPGYPLPQTITWHPIFDRIDIGGQPHDTYTTLRLHSPPSQLSDVYLSEEVDNEYYKVFTTEHHTPISIFTGARGHLRIAPYPYNFGTGREVRPAFLFSFECKYY